MIKVPRILSTKTVTSSRLFKVEEVGLRFGNGREMFYERLTGHSGGVLVVPVTGDKGLLLVREYAVGFERYELGFVKGRIENAELPQLAASREMREEIGFGRRRISTLGDRIVDASIFKLPYVYFSRARVV